MDDDDDDEIYMAVARSQNEEWDSQIRQISGMVLHDCKPYGNKLCYITRFAGDAVQRPSCIKKLFHGTTVEDLSNHCPMRCHPSNQTTITEVGEAVYIVTHLEKETIIACEDHQKEIENIEEAVGAIKIHVPCQCMLKTSKEVIIPRKYPCIATRKTPTYNHVLPATWSNLKSFILNPILNEKQPTYQNVNECLNRNWTLEIPHLNLSDISKIREDLNANYQAASTYTETYGVHTNTLYLCWNCALSAVVMWIWIRQNRNVGILATPLRVQAQGNLIPVPKSHDILFIINCTLFGVFVAALVYKIYREYQRKNSAPESTPLRERKTTTNVEKDEEKEEEEKMLRGPKEHILQIAEGDTIRVIRERQN